MKKRLFVLIALVLFAFFFGLGSYGLIDPDEGRYAEIPREMLESGDFVTPKLNYVKYFEKPALHYWLTAGSFALFGQNEFAARLTPALCALAGIGATFAFARRLWGLRPAVYSAAILSTSLLWVAVARLNILDMTVSFFITLSVAGFWWGTQDESPKSRRGLLLFYAGMALATLTKGLIGIVIPGGIAFWYIVCTRRWRLILRAIYWPGIALFFLLAVPWFWAVCRANGDFFQFFFIQEHFLRYTTKIHDRYEPTWFFIPVLIGGLLPWAGLLPDMLRNAFLPRLFPYEDDGEKEAKKISRSPELFLGLWFAVPFVFFSLSSSKLIPYILPCLPPLAILGGRVLTDIADGDGKTAKRFAILNGVLLALPALAGVVYPFWDKKLGPEFLLPYTLPATASLLLLVCGGWWFCSKRSYKTMIDVLCVLAFANVLVFSQGYELKAGLDSSKDLAAVIQERLKPEDVVVAYRNPMQGLGFYLKRRIVLADVLGELKFGALQEKDPRWFIDSEALKLLWHGKERVFIVAEKHLSEKLEKLLGGKPTLVVHTPGNIVLTNH